MKAKLLDPAINLLKDTCMANVISYIKKLLDDKEELVQFERHVHGL